MPPAPPLEAAIRNLRTLLSALDLPKGIANSFDAKVRAALDALADGDTVKVCASLQAFVNHARAQSGKHITPAVAERLITEAAAAAAALGCSVRADVPGAGARPRGRGREAATL